MRTTSKPAATPAAVKRLAGLDLTATRAFLLKDCFVAGQGFWSYYAGTGSVSCATTAICAYALAEMDALTSRQTRDLRGRRFPENEAGRA